ncbi:MAG: glycosyltransferase [Candidatus Dormibacteria bacterium]|jgi:glycosyltransferase involved in cell wall biosynthesis
MARVLVTANDVISERLAGPGIRCVELGQQLALAGHEVTVVAIESVPAVFPGLTIVGRQGASGLDALVRNHDAVLVEGLSLVRYPSLRRSDIPIIVDLYDPFPLAILEQESHQMMSVRENSSSNITAALRDLLECGDFFICASERQRDLWLGSLLAAGRINPRTWEADNSLRQLIDVVPFGVSDLPPPVRHPQDRSRISRQLGERASVLLWAGGIYNWFDPLSLIRSVARVSEELPDIRLVFMSSTHPNRGVPERMWMPQRARQLADELGVLDSVVLFNDTWVPYDQRALWLAAADCGVSTHFDHAETRYAFRTRMLDYLWARLPIICSDGDFFADLVRQHGLGWVVAPEDEPDLVRALRAFGQRGEEYEAMRSRVAAVAATMTWGNVTEPLRAYCEHPSRAADLPRSVSEIRQDGRRNHPIRAAASLTLRGAQALRHEGLAAAARDTKRWWHGRQANSRRR